MPVMTIPTARAAGGPAADGSGKITREAVLAAALQIIDRDGAEALSMPAPGPEQYQQLIDGRLDVGIGRAALAPPRVSSLLFRHGPLGSWCTPATGSPGWRACRSQSWPPSRCCSPRKRGRRSSTGVTRPAGPSLIRCGGDGQVRGDRPGSWPRGGRA